MNNLLKLCLISLLIQASLLNALHDYIEKNELFKFWDLIISVSTESINQQDYGYGCPPLHHALIINNFEFFVLLLTHPKIIHDNVDILNQTIKEKVAISPFVKSDISYAVNFVLTDSESEKKNNKIIKSKNLFLLEEKSLILWNIEHRIYDEMNLTKALINFYEFN